MKTKEQDLVATPEHATGTLPPAEVRSMFDRIAPVYDAMNR